MPKTIQPRLPLPAALEVFATGERENVWVNISRIAKDRDDLVVSGSGLSGWLDNAGICPVHDTDEGDICEVVGMVAICLQVDARLVTIITEILDWETRSDNEDLVVKVSDPEMPGEDGAISIPESAILAIGLVDPGMDPATLADPEGLIFMGNMALYGVEP